MARTNARSRSKFPATEQGVKRAIGFFSAVDSTVERVGEWDIKRDAFCEAVLGLLEAGYSLGLYTHWSGEQIVLRIYGRGDGERDDHLVRDAMELDTLMAAVNQKLAQVSGEGDGT